MHHDRLGLRGALPRCGAAGGMHAGAGVLAMKSSSIAPALGALLAICRLVGVLMGDPLAGWEQIIWLVMAAVWGAVAGVWTAVAHRERRLLADVRRGG